ncbi:MAG: hypothetical protein HYV17_07935 [Xanthomonadales bacterium]|nr:hypothetical protein [Xanthomonadales bacterium]
MADQVRVHLYRVSGRGRDKLVKAVIDARKNDTQYETGGNTYQVAESTDGRDGLLRGRIRRLQERDVPLIGTRKGADRTLAEGEGLAHRAFFMFDPARLVLLWLSSHHSCGPAWLKHIVAEEGCKISLAVYLDENAFREAKASRDVMTSLRVAVATDAAADLGVSITDKLIEEAEDMQPDVIELELKVKHQKADQDYLKKAWATVEALFKAREKKPGAVRKLKVESFDPKTGEFVARDLLRGRQYVDLESQLSVQQLGTKSAYDLLTDAHTQTFDPTP